MRSTRVRFRRVLGAHPSPMKSRTSTSAPGRSAVSARARAGALLPGDQERVGVDGLAAVGVDLEVQVRRGRLGVAGVAHVAEDRPRLDVAVVDGGGRERGEVGVEELVAAVGVDPQAVAGDRQRADVLDRPVGDRHDRRAEVGEEVVALVRRRCRRGRSRTGRRSWSCPPPGTRSASTSAACFQLGVVRAASASRSARAWRSRSARPSAGRGGGRLGRASRPRWPTPRPRPPSSPPGSRSRSSVSVTRQARAVLVDDHLAGVERVGLGRLDRADLLVAEHEVVHRAAVLDALGGRGRRALHERGGDLAAEQLDVVGLGLGHRGPVARRGLEAVEAVAEHDPRRASWRGCCRSSTRRRTPCLERRCRACRRSRPPTPSRAPARARRTPAWPPPPPTSTSDSTAEWSRKSARPSTSVRDDRLFRGDLPVAPDRERHEHGQQHRAPHERHPDVGVGRACRATASAPRRPPS